MPPPSSPIFKLCHINGKANNKNGNGILNRYDRQFGTNSCLVIGRDPTKCSLQLPIKTAAISRIHCKVFSVGRDVFIEDQSSNGTWINGKKMSDRTERKRITSGDRISLTDPNGGGTKNNNNNNNHRNTEWSWAFFSSEDGGIIVDHNTGSVEVQWDVFHRNQQQMSNNGYAITSSHPQHPQYENPAYNGGDTSNYDDRDLSLFDKVQREREVEFAQTSKRDHDAQFNLQEARRKEIEGTAATSDTTSTELRHARTGDSTTREQYEVQERRLLLQLQQSESFVRPFKTTSRLLKFYTLGHQIGSGNFATVRQGFRISDNQVVAIKIIEKSRFASVTNQNFAPKEEGLNFDMLLNEGNVLREIDHPNIIKVYDIFNEPDLFAMVMEFVPGGDLLDFVSNRVVIAEACPHGPEVTERILQRFPERFRPPFTEDEAKLLFIQLFKAVAHLQAKNIIHRDIKLENILIQIPDLEYWEKEIKHLPPKERAARLDLNKIVLKLTDFGLAKFCNNGEKLVTFCGTPTYIAPEIAKAHFLLKLKNTYREVSFARSQIGSNLSEHEKRNFEKTMRECHNEIERKQRAFLEHFGYTSAVDVYSLAICLFTLLFGGHPVLIKQQIPIRVDVFENREDPVTHQITKVQFIRQQMMEKNLPSFNCMHYPGRAHLFVRASQKVKRLIMGMIDENPSQRYQITTIGSHPWLRGTGTEEYAAALRNDLKTAQELQPTLVQKDGLKQSFSTMMMSSQDSVLDFDTFGSDDDNSDDDNNNELENHDDNDNDDAVPQSIDDINNNNLPVKKKRTRKQHDDTTDDGDVSTSSIMQTQDKLDRLTEHLLSQQSLAASNNGNIINNSMMMMMNDLSFSPHQSGNTEGGTGPSLFSLDQAIDGSIPEKIRERNSINNNNKNNNINYQSFEIDDDHEDHNDHDYASNRRFYEEQKLLEDEQLKLRARIETGEEQGSELKRSDRSGTVLVNSANQNTNSNNNNNDQENDFEIQQRSPPPSFESSRSNTDSNIRRRTKPVVASSSSKIDDICTNTRSSDDDDDTDIDDDVIDHQIIPSLGNFSSSLSRTMEKKLLKRRQASASPKSDDDDDDDDDEEILELTRRLGSPKKVAKVEQEEEEEAKDDGFEVPTTADAESLLSPRLSSTASPKKNSNSSSSLSLSSSSGNKNNNKKNCIKITSSIITLDDDDDDDEVNTNSDKSIQHFQLPPVHHYSNKNNNSSVITDDKQTVVRWFWKSDLDKPDRDESAWTAYLAEQTTKIEDAYATGRKKVRIPPGYDYVIIFQTNEDGYFVQCSKITGNKRLVKRSEDLK